MLKIIYTEKGNSYSDFNLLENAQLILDTYQKSDNKNLIIMTSTENIILALRVLVSRGKLKYNELCIVFNEHTITLNEYCELTKHPQGFMDWELKFLREIIGRRIGRKI